MGIHGLWPLLEPTSTAITLDALEGKRLAIDVSFWLYQAQQGYANNGFTVKCPHLMLMLNRIAKLLFYKIRPVFVFDGDNIPRFKKQILRDRCLKRHMKEIEGSQGQKRLFERMAKEQLSSVENSMDGFADSNSPTKAAKNFLSAVRTHLDVPSTSTAACSNVVDLPTFEKDDFSEEDSTDSDEIAGKESGIYSSKLDAQIMELEEVKERQRNAKLQPWEIPEDSNQFSQFQLKRLVKRNRLSNHLDKLRTDKVRNTVRLQLPDSVRGERRLIVTDKHQRTHVLTRSEEIQIIEPEKAAKEDFSWPKFLQLQAKQNLAAMDAQEEKEGRKDRGAGGAENSSNSSEDDGDFVEVSDLELEEAQPAEIVPYSDDPPPTQIPRDVQSSASGSDDDIIPLNSEAGSDCDASNSHGEEEEDFFRPKNGQAFGQLAMGRTNGAEAEGVYADCQKLLALLGLPFLQAPAEAEAQCVELERLNLVDGVVSDDSDVWLFGASQVYKNMFSRKREVQKYSDEEVQKKLGLSQSEFIQLGMLAGGDYSRGLEQVGMVAALELVSEFVTNPSEGSQFDRALRSLRRVREWILEKRKTRQGGDHFVESARRIRLRKIIEANNSDELIKMFPNEEVFQAYAHPLVDSSPQKFHWKRVEFERLEHFLEEKLGLSGQRVDKMTNGALQRWDEFMAQQTQSYQPRITNFTQTTGSFGGILGASSTLAPTGRVQKALEKLKEKSTTTKEAGGEDEEEILVPEEKQPKTRKRKTMAKRSGRKRKNQQKGRPTTTSKRAKAGRKAVGAKKKEEFTLSEESSSSPSTSSSTE